MVFNDLTFNNFFPIKLLLIVIRALTKLCETAYCFFSL